MADATRHVLRLLAEGAPLERLLLDHPHLTPKDVKRAAAEALAALETPRLETREERIARLRKTYPRAYEPWSDDEDSHVLRRWDEGARLSAIAKEAMRPPNAIRARLEKWLGPTWRRRGAEPTGEDDAETTPADAGATQADAGATSGAGAERVRARGSRSHVAARAAEGGAAAVKGDAGDHARNGGGT